MGLHTRAGGRVPCVIPDHPGGGAGRCGPGRVPALGRVGRGPDPRIGGRQAGLQRPCGAVGGRWGGWVLWPPGPISGAHRVGLRRRGCRAPRPGPGPQEADGQPLTTAPGKPPAPPPRATSGPRGGGHYLGDGFSSLLPPAWAPKGGTRCCTPSFPQHMAQGTAPSRGVPCAPR